MIQTMKIELIHEDKVIHDLDIPKNHIYNFLDYFKALSDEEILSDLIDVYCDRDLVLHLLKNYDDLQIRVVMTSDHINLKDTLDDFLIEDYREAINQVTMDLKDKYGLQNDQINTIIRRLKETL